MNARPARAFILGGLLAVVALLPFYPLVSLGLLVGLAYGFYVGVAYGAPAWLDWAAEQRRKRHDSSR